MKTNKYADLIKFGLTQKTLMTLSESSINSLHKNLIEGKKSVCPVCGMKECKCKHSKKKETKEETKQTVVQSTYDISSNEDQKKLAQKGIKVDPVTRKITLNQGKEDKKNMKVIRDGEMSEAKKKKTKKINPFAICTSQLGNEYGTTERHLWNAKQNNKYERCVKAIKQSMNESRNNEFALILENKILSLVEKHIQPKMKKGDLMNLIGKRSIQKPIATLGSIDVTEDTAPAPTKPTTKPTTKPGTKPDTGNPYQPKTSPPPKARKETREDTTTAPAPTKPTTKPTTKPGTKPDTGNPYQPKTSPKPKARKSMPSWMSFDTIGIKLKK
jgi:hypothetical protein